MTAQEKFELGSHPMRMDFKYYVETVMELARFSDLF